jgi:hypothetical protein
VGNFQDRLVSELRLARAKTKAEAQAVLDQFRVDYIRKFTKPAAQCEPAWRKASLTQIEQGLCFKDQRTVTKDNTVTFEGTVFQISKKSPYRSYSNKRIDVHVLLDGAVEFFYQKKKSLASTPKTTHVFGLYRTNGKREAFRYGPPSAVSEPIP